MTPHPRRRNRNEPLIAVEAPPMVDASQLAEPPAGLFHSDPPPVEVICDLDWVEYEMRGFGARYTLTGKKRRKAQLASAARLLDEGTPFIFDGRRIPGSAS